MPEREFATQSKRGLVVIMTREDEIALTQILRAQFSPLEIIGVDFGQKQMQVLETLADGRLGMDLYITNPDPGEMSLERLQTSLLFCSNGQTDIFRSSLPRRQAGYHGSNAVRQVTTRIDGRGKTVELFGEGRFFFTYDRSDPEAHRFANKVLRLLSKMLVNRFAWVDAETNEVVSESWPTVAYRAGPGALESCRRHPDRYIGIGRMRDEETRLFKAPLPAAAYEKQPRRKARD